MPVARSSCRGCACANGATCTGNSSRCSRSRAGSGRDELAPTIDAARYQVLHEALLSGLLGNVGTRDDGEGYAGARGIRFHLHPGSGLAKKAPRWVLAAELVETTRLYARCAGRVEPEWIEAVAGERVDRDYFEPRWDADRGEVIASERVRLYGLTLVARRRVSFGRIDPVVARQVFIREGLVTGELRTKGAFLAHNRRLVAEVAELEHKARRQDVLVDDEAIAGFYDSRVPADVHSTAGFERWRADAEARDPEVLFMTREALMRHAALNVTPTWFPDALTMAGARLALAYRFAPGHPRDGLTLAVPLALLNQLDAARLTWLVPGMIREKATFYLKALPKAFRNRLVPLPDFVTAFLETEPSQEAPLPDALRDFIRQRLREAPPGGRVGRRRAAAASRAERPRRGCGGQGARRRPRSRRTAGAARRSGAAVVRRQRTGPRTARPQGVEFRRPAADADASQGRAAADRLSCARRRRATAYRSCYSIARTSRPHRRVRGSCA